MNESALILSAFENRLFHVLLSEVSLQERT